MHIPIIKVSTWNVNWKQIIIVKRWWIIMINSFCHHLRKYPTGIFYFYYALVIVHLLFHLYVFALCESTCHYIYMALICTNLEGHPNTNWINMMNAWETHFPSRHEFWWLGTREYQWHISSILLEMFWVYYGPY